ncbi:MAG TPA: hypothetical protein ENN84_10460 [Candidatus Marinimicrobia bacterium]|nr:hypothetical protein [Candidatus Neomarinimicrobiota bacterium]
MTGRCIDPLTLEKFIMSEYTKDKDYSIIEHLNSCRFCAQRYKELKLFYSALASNLAYNSPPFPANVHLKNVNCYTMKLKPMADENDKIQFAAESKQGCFFKMVAVYSADEDNLLIRLLEKKETQEFQLCLIADDPVLYEFVVVHIDGFDESYISDASGCVKLGKIEIKEPNKLVFRVHTPDIVYTLNSREVVERLEAQSDPKEITLKKAVEGRYELCIKKSAERYDLDFIQKSPADKGHKIAIGSEDNEMYPPVHMSETSFGFTRIPLKKDFILRLYFSGSQK